MTAESNCSAATITLLMDGHIYDKLLVNPEVEEGELMDVRRGGSGGESDLFLPYNIARVAQVVQIVASL